MVWWALGALLVLSAAISWFLTPVVLRLARKNRAFDTFDARKVHTRRVPRLGTPVRAERTAVSSEVELREAEIVQKTAEPILRGWILARFGTRDRAGKQSIVGRTGEEPCRSPRGRR